MEPQPTPAPKPRFSPDIWFYLFVFVVLGIIGVVLYVQHNRALDEKQQEINRLSSDTTRLSEKVQSERSRADSKQQELDRQAALYGQSTAKIADLKRTIADQAAQLSTPQQIDAIASALGPQFKGEAERIKKAATEADSKLIAELYRRVLWGEQQAAKLDTALRENARLRVDNERLTSREPLYMNALIAARRLFLTEADIDRFLGIGRKDAMKKGAEAVDNVISDLENELNTTRR